MTDKDTLTLLITVVLAFSGYMLTYFNNRRLAQRSERLNRVNRQLAELYGPLFAMTQATDRTWREFRTKYRPVTSFFDADDAPTEADLAAWRLWMTTVFMPTNLRMYELVLSKSDLLIETEMPKCLLELAAHVTAYQTVMKKWETQDYSENTSLIDYPSRSLIKYARSAYAALKTEQARLIGYKIDSADKD